MCLKNDAIKENSKKIFLRDSEIDLRLGGGNEVGTVIYLWFPVHCKLDLSIELTKTAPIHSRSWYLGCQPCNILF